jgi:hypothetical protein
MTERADDFYAAAVEGFAPQAPAFLAKQVHNGQALAGHGLVVAFAFLRHNTTRRGSWPEKWW